MTHYFPGDPQGGSIRPISSQPDNIYSQLENGVIIRIDTSSGIFNFGIMFLSSIEPLDPSIKSDQLPDRIIAQLCLSAISETGIRHNGSRSIQLATRFSRNERFQTDFHTILPPSQLKGESKLLDRPHTTELILKLNNKDQILNIGYSDSDGVKFYKSISVRAQLPYFRYFDWGPLSNESIIVNTISIREENQHIDSFRIGNLIVRKGDMFNPDAILNSNVMFLPASDSGAVTPTIRAKIDELHLPPPPPNKAGSVVLYSLAEDKGIRCGFAYSVEGDDSNISIIENICANILDLILDTSSLEGRIKGLNIPLLGTGAGGLEPVEVMAVYLKYFYNPELNFNVIVSLSSADAYDQIRQRYSHAYLPLLNEYFNEKPPEARRIERELGTELSGTDFEIGFRGQLTSLSLVKKKFKHGLKALQTCTSLRYLILDHCDAMDFSPVGELKDLRSLSMRGCLAIDYKFLDRLTRLESLDLAGQKNPFLDQLANVLPNLLRLGLASNSLTDISFLYDLKKLLSLELGFNEISDITPLSSLVNLSELTVCNNSIRDIIPVLRLKKLRFLDASNNLISELEIKALPRALQFLRLGNNPFLGLTDISLVEGGNHIGAIRNYLLRQAEQQKYPVRLPAKVLLMGNHASGKSSLLHYIQTGKLPKDQQSTHIIQICPHGITSSGLPKAIFYDFGGQDYYHGIYRAFLSGGAINLMLWNMGNNANQMRRDSHGHMTQDFSLDYWLAQKQYIEVEKQQSEYAPTLIIQSHSDQHPKQSYLPKTHIQPIENDFYVCLSRSQSESEGSRKEVGKRALKYLSASLEALIEENGIHREEPQWYIDFLVYIIGQNATADHRGTMVSDLLPHYARRVSNKKPLLLEDLRQLNRQGLVLYYPEQIPDIVWLNPMALVEHVHSHILSREHFGSSNGTVPVGSFPSQDEKVIDLLTKHKVIHLHRASQEYIIPNFLPLAKRAKAEFELYTFGLGDPIFTLRCRDFLPFGLINQIICFFGDLPEEKKFWRDRIIFTLDSKAKVLINIDFQQLEITVYASFIPTVSPSEKLEIERYLFYGIMGLYWDLDLLKFKDYQAYLSGSLKSESFALENPLTDKLWATENFYQNSACRPNDLFISVNGKDFISYCELCDIGEAISISSVSIDGEGMLGEKRKSIPVHPFQAFTIAPLKRRKKVAISYSKQDLALVNKFREYLVPLYDDELIDHPWYCTELIAGTEWDAEIQKKFDEADIIFFMISENLMSTRYVLDNEIKNAIEKYDRDQLIRIVPIVMVPYHFQRKGTYNLGRFSALPYTLRPVILFESEHLAWHTISESIRIMIEKQLDPGRGDELTVELKRYFEEIIEQGKKTKKRKKKTTLESDISGEG